MVYLSVPAQNNMPKVSPDPFNSPDPFMTPSTLNPNEANAGDGVFQIVKGRTIQRLSVSVSDFSACLS